MFTKRAVRISGRLRRSVAALGLGAVWALTPLAWSSSAAACGDDCRACREVAKVSNQARQAACDSNNAARKERCSRFVGDNAKVNECHDRADAAQASYKGCMASARTAYKQDWQGCFD